MPTRNRMAQRLEAHIEPAVLVWARHTSAYELDEAARRAGVRVDALAEWEAGAARPSVAQARKLADVYQRPLAALFLSSPPPSPSLPHDFRTLPGTGKPALTPLVTFEIRRSRSRRGTALEMMDELGETPPVFDPGVTIGMDPEQIGARLRSALGVSIADQASWRGESAAFGNWRYAAEGAGVLVFQAMGIDPKEMRGLSLPEQPLPVAVVNIKDHPRARAFSLLHELAHIALHQAGVCDLVEAGQRGEVICNHAAGAALMPISVIEGDDALGTITSDRRFSDAIITRSARRYKVSREMIVRRLLILGRVSQDLYDRMRQQYMADFTTRPRSTSGFMPPASEAFYTAGRLYTSLVLDTYAESRITASDASDYLGVRVGSFPKIAKLIAGGSHKEDSD